MKSPVKLHGTSCIGTPGGLTWEAPAPHAAVPTEAIAICCDAKSLPDWHYTSAGWKIYHDP
jgi:hypothetical protein